MKTSIGIGLTSIPRQARKPAQPQTKKRWRTVSPSGNGDLRQAVAERRQAILERVKKLEEAGDEWLVREAEFWKRVLKDE